MDTVDEIEWSGWSVDEKASNWSFESSGSLRHSPPLRLSPRSPEFPDNIEQPWSIQRDCESIRNLKRFKSSENLQSLHRSGRKLSEIIKPDSEIVQSLQNYITVAKTETSADHARTPRYENQMQVVLKDDEINNLKSKDSIIVFLLFKLCQTFDPTLGSFYKYASNLFQCGVIKDVHSLQKIKHSKPISIFDHGFLRMGILGRGGFGTVFRAKHRLDNRVYAIKVIPYPSAAFADFHDTRVFREVSNLSRLDHPNICRYYSTWVENKEVDIKTPTPTTDPTSVVVQNTPSCVISPNYLSEKLIMSNQPITEPIIASDSPNNDFGCEWLLSPEHPTYSPPTSIAEINRMGSPENPARIEYQADEIAYTPNATSQRTPPLELSPSRVVAKRALYSTLSNCKLINNLYIQMEFCGWWNLKHYIQNSERVPNRLYIIHVMKEILKGLIHVHEKELIHRDLKPANIFLDFDAGWKIEHKTLRGNELVLHDTTSRADDLPDDPRLWKIRLGDFGLSRGNEQVTTPTFLQMPINENDEFRFDNLTVGLGTRMYAAPEQIASCYDCKDADKAHDSYSDKVDIYSLGIIFFELLHEPCDTSMERAMILKDVREGTIPEEVRIKFPKLSVLLEKLIKENPEERPTAKDVLKELCLLELKDSDVILQDLFKKSKKELIEEIILLRMRVADQTTEKKMKDEAPIADPSEILEKLKSLMDSHQSPV